MDPVELQIRQQFPQMIWAITHPELGALLRRAVSEGWDGARFQGELLNTAWFKATAEQERTWERLSNEDPATASKLFDEAVVRVRSLAARAGVTLQDDGGRFAGQFGEIARGMVRSGWDENRAMQEILNRASYGGDQAQQGTLGGAQDQVKRMAGDYLVPMADQDAWEMGRKMVTGQIDQQGMQAYFKDMAVARFQGNESVTRMINSGFTPAQIFAPYVQQTAQLLELSPSEVDLMDPKFSPIIDYADPAGKIRPMSLTEAAQHVRASEAFKGTQGAVTQAAEFAEMLGQTFGRIA